MFFALIYYLWFFGFLIFCVFMSAYRLDELLTVKAHFFKRIKLNKTISKFFLYKDKRNGILNIALIFQIIGYMAIPLSIVLTCIFILKGYSSNFEFNRSFGKAIFYILTGMGIVIIMLMIINRRWK